MRIVTSRSQVAGDHMVLALAAQRDEEPSVVVHACADFSGAIESSRHLWVAKAPSWHEAYAERVLQGDFAMMARRRFWQAAEEVEAKPQMTLGLNIRCVLHRAV